MDLLRGLAPIAAMRKALSAVVDQALVSAGTFVLNVLLARFTTPTDYGIFVLCFSGIVLSTELQNAVITEPMMVFGSARLEGDRSRYLGAVLALQLALVALFVTTICAAAWLWARLVETGGAASTLIYASAALGGTHLRELARKSFYSSFAPGRALLNDALYSALLFTGIALVTVRGDLSTNVAFLILGAAGAAAGLTGLVAVGAARLVSQAEIRDALRLHWRYGKWMIGVSGARWSANELYYFVAAGIVGVAGSGALKAVQNVFAPISLFLSGLSNLLLPIVSGMAAPSQRRLLNRFVLAVGSILAPIALVYLAVVYLGAESTFDLLYDGAFLDYAYLLPIFGAGHVLVAAFQGPSLGLRALDRPRSVFTITAISALATVVAVIPLTSGFGLAGAAGSMLLSILVGSPLWALVYLRAARRTT